MGRVVVETWHQKNRAQCWCGNMMQPYTWDFSKWIPGYVVIRCTCSKQLDRTNFTNTCGCGRDYNFAGTELGRRAVVGLL